MKSIWRVLYFIIFGSPIVGYILGFWLATMLGPQCPPPDNWVAGIVYKGNGEFFVKNLHMIFDDDSNTTEAALTIKSGVKNSKFKNLYIKTPTSGLTGSVIIESVDSEVIKGDGATLKEPIEVGPPLAERVIPLVESKDD
jgi:hypothetical protein